MILIIWNTITDQIALSSIGQIEKFSFIIISDKSCKDQSSAERI